MEGSCAAVSKTLPSDLVRRPSKYGAGLKAALQVYGDSGKSTATALLLQLVPLAVLRQPCTSHRGVGCVSATHACLMPSMNGSHSRKRGSRGGMHLLHERLHPFKSLAVLRPSTHMVFNRLRGHVWQC